MEIKFSFVEKWDNHIENWYINCIDSSTVILHQSQSQKCSNPHFINPLNPNGNEFIKKYSQWCVILVWSLWFGTLARLWQTFNCYKTTFTYKFTETTAFHIKNCLCRQLESSQLYLPVFSGIFMNVNLSVLLWLNHLGTVLLIHNQCVPLAC